MPQSDVPARFTDRVQFILHLTDFSESSEAAFEHALRLALTNRCELTVLHVGGGEDADWESFPSFRETLKRWGEIAPDAGRSDVVKLGLSVKKIAVAGRDVAGILADFATRHPVDLLVLAAEQRSPWEAWLQRESADVASLKTGLPVLFVPSKGRGCVSSDDGCVTMRQVLIPVDHQPSPDAAIERGLRAIAAFGDGESQLTLLYVGAEEGFPDVTVPAGPWRAARTVRDGKPADAIATAAEEINADLVIMVTQGTDCVLDVLRGTTTEQVLRRTPCPLLAIPATF